MTTELDTTPEVDNDDLVSEQDVTGETDDARESLDDETRQHVQGLRKEAAKYRTRLRDSEAKVEDLRTRLHTQLVTATGKLADPSDLAYDDTHLDDNDALHAAIDALVDSKPHLASRRPVGDVGQGATPEATTVDLAGMLRRSAS